MAHEVPHEAAAPSGLVPMPCCTTVLELQSRRAVMSQPVFHQQLPVTSEKHNTELSPCTLHLSCCVPSDSPWTHKPFYPGPSLSNLLPALLAVRALLLSPYRGDSMQPHKKSTLVLLAALPSPCWSDEAKTCIRRVRSWWVPRQAKGPGLCPGPAGREHSRSPLPSLLWQVLKTLPLRKVLKSRKRRILRLQEPACQSWWVLLDKEPPASCQLLLEQGPHCPWLCPGRERGPGTQSPVPLLHSIAYGSTNALFCFPFALRCSNTCWSRRTRLPARSMWGCRRSRTWRWAWSWRRRWR